MQKINKIILVTFMSLLIVFTCFYLLTSFSTPSLSDVKYAPKIDTLSMKVTLPAIPIEINFCSEKLPLIDEDIKERLDREIMANAFSHSATSLILKRSGKYFPVIEKILKEQNIPDDLKYLCVAESQLSNAVSPSYAVGFWQFLESTGRIYGLEINEEIDERYHLEKSTIAACNYLTSIKNKTGSWTLAAAGYNLGDNGIINALNTQRQNSYYNCWLNQETSRYLFRIAAIKAIMQNPTIYGYNFTSNDYYKPFKYSEININYSIPDLSIFAAQNNITYKQLKNLNPWLRKNSLTNKHKKLYTIKIESK